MSTGKPKLYLDACCLNRPFDDRSQDRIRLEAEAVLLILQRVEAGEWQWVKSVALELEIERTPDLERRARVQLLLQIDHPSDRVGAAQIERARQLESLGFQAFDALHLACAEHARADIFLTTDDRLIRRAARLGEHLNVRVANPLLWLTEVLSP